MSDTDPSNGSAQRGNPSVTINPRVVTTASPGVTEVHPSKGGDPIDTQKAKSDLKGNEIGKKGGGNPLGIDRARLSTLGVDCVQEIELSETGKGSLPKRWKMNQQLYDLDPEATNLTWVPGVASYPIPLSKPKIDRITASVYKTMTSVEPYCKVLPDSEEIEDKERADRLQKALQVIATAEEETGFDQAFWQCLEKTAIQGVSVLYSHMAGDGEMLFDCIAPADFCAYPHELKDIKRMKTIGHRYWMLASEIQALQESEQYIDVPITGSDDVGERGSQNQEFAGAVQTPERAPEDGLVECWQLVRRCNLGKHTYEDQDGKTVTVEGNRDYLICVAKAQQVVLKVQPLDYKRGRMYFAVRFGKSYGSFWPPSSPAQDMQGLQLIFSDGFNVFLQGVYSTAFPPLLLINMSLETKINRYGPGMVIEASSGADMKSVPINFNGQGLVEVMNLVDKTTDSVSGLSSLGVVQPFPSGTSGTAASGYLQATQQAQDRYSTLLSPVVAEVFSFIHECLELHFEVMRGKYGDLGLKDDFKDVDFKARYIPTGKKTTTNPQSEIQKYDMLLQMADHPKSPFDVTKLQRLIAGAIDLAVDITGIEKDPGPGLPELMQLIHGLIVGMAAMKDEPPGTPPDEQKIHQAGGIPLEEGLKIYQELVQQGVGAPPEERKGNKGKGSGRAGGQQVQRPMVPATSQAGRPGP